MAPASRELRFPSNHGADMSDDAKCDACKKHGRRPRFHPAPKDWFYLEATDDEDPKSTIIVLACSKECALLLWRIGPGERFNLNE